MSVHLQERMAVSDKHRTEQRDKVLLAARKCFVRRGFHATGMAEIADACHMSVGNIYHYFPNKNAIVQAITDEARSRMFPVLRSLEAHADPIEGLIQIMLLSLRDICCESNARLWMEIEAEAPRNKHVRDVCLGFDRDFREILKRLMKRAQEAGQLATDIDLAAASLWLVALLDGAIARLAVEPDLDESTVNTLVRSIRRCLCCAAS